MTVVKVKRNGRTLTLNNCHADAALGFMQIQWRTLAPTMRQIHRAGEKALADFSGKRPMIYDGTLDGR